MAQQKYTIIDKLDAGGMAEVWKSRAASMRGFEKLVAIKRVLPELARNEKFIAMFLDEARLSLHLNHANVVQTFDIGRSGNSWFIVMEFVNGSNLKKVMNLARDNGYRLPQELVAFICKDICKGLYHAHRRRDARNRPLNIVHRDVSPPNVLVSVEGEVKMVDFGLAKAATQAALTDPGIVKGKFSYLSPEAAYGEKVDSRADIFSTGIVMWEMLAGVRLFDGRTDLETVQLVRRAKVPPLKDYHEHVHPDLERIVRKALARQPRDRYQSAADLARDLARFLFNHRLMVTSYDVADLVKRVRTEWASSDPDKPKVKHTRSTASITPGRQHQNEVQEEIGDFTSIEDLERMSFKPVSETEPGVNLSAEMDITGGEDPRQWTTELGLDLDDPSAPPSPKRKRKRPSRPAPPPPPGGRPGPPPPPIEALEASMPSGRGSVDAEPTPALPATPPPSTPDRNGADLSAATFIEEENTEEITSPDLDTAEGGDPAARRPQR